MIERLLNAHIDIPMGTSTIGLNFCLSYLSLHLHPYFKYESSESSGDLRSCTGFHEHSLLENAMNTKAACAGSHILLSNQFRMIL